MIWKGLCSEDKGQSTALTFGEGKQMQIINTDLNDQLKIYKAYILIKAIIRCKLMFLFD